MLNKEKQDMLDENYFLNARYNRRRKKSFIKWKKWLFIFGIVTGFVLIAVTYFISDASRVYYVSVSGNDLTGEEEIRSLSEVDDTDCFLFVNTGSIERKIKEHPFIDEVTVEKKEGNLVAIQVSEVRLIGYTDYENEAYFISDEGELIQMDEDSLSLITRVPLIEGFDKETLMEIAVNFQNLDSSIISSISEIHRYPFSYDENMMEMVMKDGNYCFVSRFGVDLLKDYYSVVSKLDLQGEKACLFLDEVTDTYQYRKCPWELTEDTSE